MIQAVIFDIDNTLYSYDDAHAVAWQALCGYVREQLHMDTEEFQRRHSQAQELVKRRLGTDCAALHNRQLRYQVLLEEAGKPLHHAIAMNDLYWSRLIGAAKPNPGILDCLVFLKERDYRIGIGTDMTIDYQLKKLTALGLLPYFDFIVSSEEVNVEKPDPKLFACCAEKAGTAAENCLFIGDHLKKDVLGAMGAGMQALWYGPKEEARRQHPEIPTIYHYDALMQRLMEEKT